MSGQGLNVDPALLQQLAGRVDGVKLDLDGILAKVQRIAEELADPRNWDGEGASRFVQVNEEWRQNGVKLVRALTGISEGLTSNRTGMENAEADVAAHIGRVGSGATINIPG